MRYGFGGALATAASLALSGTALAQSTLDYYGVVAPAATSTYQSQISAQPVTNYASQPVQSYTQPAATTYAPQQAGTTYATSPAATTYATDIGTAYAQPSAPTPNYTTSTAPSPTYIAPTYGTATNTYDAPTFQQPQQPSYQQPAPIYQPAQTTYQQPTFQPAQPTYQAAQPTYQSATTPSYGGSIYGQPLAPTAPVAATAYTPSVPVSTNPNAGPQVSDTDTWTLNFARYYPAVQACLRKSVTKNPVIANIQVSDNKTVMLIGEGGSSSYSTCSTGLSGTVVKANSDVRNLPPAFFAPIGSTFTVAPDRPFQPIVDTNQKVIGWLVRTQPSQGVNQFGQAPGFDGQFIPPMMVNTSVGQG